jgi:polyisoprenoid-binding protein YceI
MKTLLAVAALTAAFSFRTDPVTSPAPKDAWIIDTAHSSVVFKVKHAGSSWFYGVFKTVTGTIALDAAAPDQSSFAVEIDAASIDTRIADRDQHLRGPDFFDCKQFPTLSFTSSKVEKAGDDFTVAGTLSLHGIDKPLTVVVKPSGTGEMMGKKVAGFETTFVIKRSDFGIEYGLAQKALGDEVHLTIAVEANPMEAKKEAGKSK